jgi:hypothetical protein
MVKAEIRQNLQQTAGIGASLLLFMSPSLGVPIPSRTHHLPGGANSTRLLSSSDNLILNGFYVDDINHVVVLRDFALNLLANTKELDENIAAALNTHFWDLYEPI